MDDCYVEAEESVGYSEERRLSECGKLGFLRQGQLNDGSRGGFKHIGLKYVQIR